MLVHNSWGRNRSCTFSQKMFFLIVDRLLMPSEFVRITSMLERLVFQFFIALRKFKYYQPDQQQGLLKSQSIQTILQDLQSYFIFSKTIVFFHLIERKVIQINSTIKLSQLMNSKNESLLGFLKKQSLFPNSPVRSIRKRSRSKSRDSREYQQRSNYAPSGIDSSQASRGLNRAYQQDFAGKSTGNVPKTYVPYVEANRYQYNAPEKYSPKYNFEIKDFKDRSSDQKLSTSEVNNNVWTDLMSHSGTFQSARIESSQCLSILTSKIGNEISNINFKIQNLNNKIQKTITNELQSVQQKIKMIFESAFRESERYMKEYVRQKQLQLAGDLFKMRDILLKQQEKVDSMRNQLTKPQWKKIAGQILSTDLENRIEELIKKSNYLQIKQWDLGDIGGLRIKNIQKQLKDIIRLKS